MYVIICAMSLPDNLHGQEYIDGLKEYLEAAEIESHRSTTVKRLGLFSYSSKKSTWQAASGGAAVLRSREVAHDNTVIHGLLPAKLRILNNYGGPGYELVTYNIDFGPNEFDTPPNIEIYRSLLEGITRRDIFRAEMGHRKDRKMDRTLMVPTDEDRELLYTELLRGATGIFKTGSTES